MSNFFRRNQGTAEHRPMSALKCQHQHLELGAFGHPTLNNSEFFIFPYFPERHFLAHPKIPFDTKVGRTCLTAAMWLCLKLEDTYIILHKIAMSCHVMIFPVQNNEKPICSHKIYRQPPYFNTKRFSDSLWSPLPRSIFPMPRHGTNHPNAKPNVPCYARAFLRGQVFVDLTIWKAADRTPPVFPTVAGSLSLCFLRVLCFRPCFGPFQILRKTTSFLQCFMCKCSFLFITSLAGRELNFDTLR